MSASVQLDEKADYRLALKTYQLRMDELIAVSVSEMYVDTEKLHNRSEKTRFVKMTWLKQSTWSTLLPSPTPHLADPSKIEPTFNVEKQAETRFLSVFRQPTACTIRNQGQKPQGDEICENNWTQKGSTWPTFQKMRRPSKSKRKRRSDFLLFSDNQQRVCSEIKSKNPKETRFVKMTRLKTDYFCRPAKNETTFKVKTQAEIRFFFCFQRVNNAYYLKSRPNTSRRRDL